MADHGPLDAETVKVLREAARRMAHEYSALAEQAQWMASRAEEPQRQEWHDLATQYEGQAERARRAMEAVESPSASCAPLTP